MAPERWSKEMHGAEDLELSDDIRLSITLQACLPILNLGLDAYGDWVGLVVYPGEFVVKREEMDAALELASQALVKSYRLFSYDLMAMKDMKRKEHRKNDHHRRSPRPRSPSLARLHRLRAHGRHDARRPRRP